MATHTTTETFRKPALLVLALLLFLAVGFFQKSLNQLRADPELQLTRVTPLENAPPVLAFTTVALGGFRGLIANVLWIRANDLQYDGKYFEMVQLADWITKLEPHFVQVWLVQAWNMTYNISVKFNDPADRWRWVQRGIELLRDNGIPYNPHEGMIYRELAWFFQHKMGQNMDDAHMFYKARWAEEMTQVLGGADPDFEALLNPQSPEDQQRLQTLKAKYKMDPAIIQQIQDRYGPLDWRLPEASAIYWAVVGLDKAKNKEKDLSMLRRVIYQSLQMSTLRGRMWVVATEQGEGIRLSPNLDLADRVNEAYLQVIQEEEIMKDTFQSAHKSFLREIIYLMYSYNRVAEAGRWMDFLKETYPGAIPASVSLEEYSLRRLAENIDSLGYDKTKALIEAMIDQSFFSKAIGEDDRAAGLANLARRVWDFYKKETEGVEQRLPLPEFKEMVETSRNRLLAPGGLDSLLQASLRTALGLPPP